MARRPSNEDQPTSGRSLIEAARHALEEVRGAHDAEEVAAYCLQLGVEMEHANEFEFAREFYAKGIDLDPRSAPVRYFLNNNIGYSLNQLGLFADAEPYCRTAIAIEDRRHNAHKNLGVSLAGQKRYAEASIQFVQATRACPADRRALLLLERLVIEAPEITTLVPGLEEDLNACRELGHMGSSPSNN